MVSYDLSRVFGLLPSLLRSPPDHFVDYVSAQL